ncbi:MAG: hypothetical protein HKN24_12420 [Acidimicrobiales bacterium]|nr:hypothetical protein [Acidimicrobiales bacterium]
MSKDSSRKALHAYVTDDAHELWHGFAAEQGVSVSAILEAMAPGLTESDLNLNPSLELPEIVTEARRIDSARRRRTR